jgi:hypothetical protein
MNLDELDDAYAKAEAPEKKAFVGIPQGRYQAKVHTVDMTETAAEKKPMLSIQFEVIAGPHTGKREFKNIVFDKDRIESLAYAKADLSMLGWNKPLSKLNDLAERQTLLDKKVEIFKQIKGEDSQGRPRTNLYINKPLETADLAASASSGGSKRATDDEPPF